MKRYQVMVGNIGTVYDGNNRADAMRDYRHYVKDSKAPYGRASGETVTMLADGNPCHEYYPEEKTED